MLHSLQTTCKFQGLCFERGVGIWWFSFEVVSGCGLRAWDVDVVYSLGWEVIMRSRLAMRTIAIGDDDDYNRRPGTSSGVIQVVKGTSLTRMK